MIDMRVLALGALALLMAAYGATTGSRNGRNAPANVVQSQPSADDAARAGEITGSVVRADRAVHVDGFNLKR